MSLGSIVKSSVRSSLDIFHSLTRHPRLSRHLLENIGWASRGMKYSRRLWPGTQIDSAPRSETGFSNVESNPLKDYFESHREGRGVWKWDHYFDIYHRHFRKFIGREVFVLEIGVFSGGSLDMWKAYFGSKCHVIGVDIEAACKAYEDERTRILVGDQADREFWSYVKKEVPKLDILIDDGGHLPEQQIVTLEEMLPHLRNSGVYMCEDVQGIFNKYSAFVYGIADNLNAMEEIRQGPDAVDKYRPSIISTNQFQRDIQSIHLYPYVTVFEKTDVPVDTLVAEKHGTEWQPYL